MIVNMNAMVAVTLTESGRVLMRGYYDRRNLPTPGEWMVTGAPIRLALWALMQIFGPRTHMGMAVPFVGNVIDIEVDQ